MRREFRMAGSDRERVPPGQTLVDDFPVLHAGSVAHVLPESFTLTLSGLVEPGKVVTWEQLLAYPAVEQTCDLHCVTTWSKLDTKWKGVRMSSVLAGLSVSPEARHTVIHAAQGWTTNLPLDELMRGDVLIAYEYEGRPLSAEHGGPVRLLAPSLYLWKSAKWLEGIEFTAEQHLGYWETRGYHELGDPWLEQRYS
jgi:DMSO/TMAO reductase YedYZ molybdopterin-dependent catalytic subunit